MTDHYWLNEAQLERIRPYFPRSHGRPPIDDRRVISGITHVIGNGLRWRDAPDIYGRHKILYNRFVRWSRTGVFDRIFGGLAGGRHLHVSNLHGRNSHFPDQSMSPDPNNPFLR